ncbi:glycosyltransferase [Flavipsychrobacter stenotrophus]|uniref:Glycosyltransferase n=1 Tax=Flavipsychrobacter stenotrophus TaxID=2077091 RepID=A0A2S7SRY6_9BACT|nr:glycosyltransferase family 2 protein [Flavipsychrobacter stenotrophus]PQJ09478.1 glycosyltransferase [Flavipsychrobacter stenotrophus]
MKKHISVITPCYNEEGNVALLVEAIGKIFDHLPQYTYEHVLIDNCSVDKTPEILREIAAVNKHVKVILNERNFGWIRSPFHGLIQCYGDAVIYMVSDFQEPPEMIPKFLEKWEEGYKIVIGIKEQSKENPVMFAIRSFFYKILASASDGEPTIKNFTGFGLYDQKFIKIVRGLDDQYPYLRGLVSELGFRRYEIPYVQPDRFAGKTSSNFFRLYDVAMLGFTNHSKLPLRISAFIGFFSAIISLLMGVGYLIYKLIFWNWFEVGLAPLVIGVFFFSSVQLFFIGIIGEYIGAINTQVRKRPLVIERERLNFDE